MAKIKIGNRYFESVSGIVVNDDNGDKSLYSKPSWSENTSTKAGYIEDRPFFKDYVSEGILTVLNTAKTYTFTGTSSASDQMFSQTDDIFNLQDPYGLIGASISYDGGNTKYTISKYVRTAYELDVLASSSTVECIVVDGPLVGLNSTIMAIYLYGASTKIPLMLHCNKQGVLDGNNSPIGLYVNYTLNSSWKYFNYTPIVINEQYLEFFKNLRNPIHIMRSTTEDISTLDFSNFEPGDIILGVLDQ